MRILLLEKKKKKKVFMKEDPEMMEKKTRLDYDSTYDMWKVKTSFISMIYDPWDAGYMQLCCGHSTDRYNT